jgi:putative transposase
MTEQVLTVSCKLSPTDFQTEEIKDTLKAFADACNWINQIGHLKIKNHVRIHGMVYQDVRTRFGLSSNLAVRAINRVAGNRKTTLKEHSTVKNFEPTSAKLCKKGSEYYIHIQVKSDAPDQICGDTIKQIKTHYTSMRAVLQQKAVKGTRSSRRRCRELQQRLSGKESRNEPETKSQWLGFLSAQRVLDIQSSASWYSSCSG